jgi:asparagine synthase (glutamine-hydrolysing)
MCGIAGFIHLPESDAPPQRILQRMVDAIHHRGPDERGQYLDEVLRVGLGHARLSIIDLATGQQPMANEDGTIWITFNGEVFNFVELHAELEKRGHVFKTRSDTEVIVHAYEEKGPDCATEFNGDFAYAIWDGPRRRLVLARDRMGVRPVYWTRIGDGLAFASEMKALFQVPGVRAELDPIALDQCFTFWFPLAPRTPFKNIHELSPGHVLVAENGSVTVRPYWQLCYPDRGDVQALEQRSDEELEEELRSLLIDATRLRLRADVPVGAYLSGGFDSSATTALIKLFTTTPLRTFSVQFEAGEFDERAFQQEVVAALETDHSAITCSAQDIGFIFPDVIRHTERPVVRTAPAPLFQLARLVRQNGFKVVLTGEGADEVFAGYDIFKEAKIRRFWSRQSASSKRPLLLRKLYPYLAGIQGQPQSYLEAFFRAGLDRPESPFFSHLPRWQMTSRCKAFFSDELRRELGDYDALEDLMGRLPERFAHWHPLSQAQYLETALLLPHYILSAQGDRVAMAHAVEGRFPFLDHRVVEFASRLPPRKKLRSLAEKAILRRSLGRFLPERVVKRAKQPYRAPDSQCFFRPSPAYVDELLGPEGVAQTGWFEVQAVSRLVRKCRLGNTPLGFRDNMALVGMLSVQLLERLFCRPPPTS